MTINLSSIQQALEEHKYETARRQCLALLGRKDTDAEAVRWLLHEALVKLGDIPGLIRKGIVRDGMIPKLLSCSRLLRKKVGEIDILSADGSSVLLRALDNGPHGGTRIVKNA